MAYYSNFGKVVHKSPRMNLEGSQLKMCSIYLIDIF